MKATKTFNLDDSKYSDLLGALDWAINAADSDMGDMAGEGVTTVRALKDSIIEQAGIEIPVTREPTTPERAEIIEHAYNDIDKVTGDNGISLMVHGFNDLKSLDESWKLNVLRTGDRVTITASKKGITLFGEL